MPLLIDKKPAESSAEKILKQLKKLPFPKECRDYSQYDPAKALGCLQREAIIARKGADIRFIGSTGFGSCVGFILRNERGDAYFAHVDFASEFDAKKAIESLSGSDFTIQIVGGHSGSIDATKKTLLSILTVINDYAIAHPELKFNITHARVLELNDASSPEIRRLDELKAEGRLVINNIAPNYYKDFVLDCATGNLLVLTPPQIGAQLALRRARLLENKINNMTYNNNYLLLAYTTDGEPEPVYFSPSFIHDTQSLRDKDGQELVSAAAKIVPNINKAQSPITAARYVKGQLVVMWEQSEKVKAFPSSSHHSLLSVFGGGGGSASAASPAPAPH
ncbi:MAG: hypothetical protein K0S29_680 [Gammaproteobacteria bacterium]|jgi:hypothetical protein|nr:hypothetical protein [Gammaproteobacteria bacterium]